MAQTATNDEHLDLVGEAVEEYFAALEQGERPQLEQFIKRYPDIENVLRSVIPALQVAEGTSKSRGEVPTEKQLGDFRILRQIGRGGMGIVYEAEQISMGRRVALKVLPMAGLVDELKIQRFQNEVRAVAALDHPHIVSVYTVGEERGVHYFAMQMIRGRSLDRVISSLGEVRDEGERLDGKSVSRITGSSGSDDAAGELQATAETAYQQETPTDQDATVNQPNDSSIPGSTRREYFRSVAALGIQAANALEHAHNQGVIHRDIKPANLLLDRASKLYVTDFGLARVEADAGVTMTGDLVGTLRYMAPEQALAQRVIVDHRADIYSLAVTLYELLTLQPAYPTADRQQLLKQIAFEEPASLRRIDPQIPSELEVIVQKGMSKDMDERYSSAQELGDDLRRFLENRPIKAKPPTLSQMVTKWTRRNPAIAWASTVTVSIVAVAFGVSSLLIARQRDKAVQSSEDLRVSLYGSEMNVAYQAFDKGRLTRVHDLLRNWLPEPGEADLRGAEWYLLAALCDENEAETMVEFQDRVTAVAYADKKDMAFVALTSPDEDSASLQMINLTSPAKRNRLDTLDFGNISCLAVSPDGKRLAIGGRVGTGHFVNDAGSFVRDGSGKIVIKKLDSENEFDTEYEMESNDPIQAVDFSRNGRVGGSVTDQGVVSVWDANSGEIRWSNPGHRLNGHKWLVRVQLKFSPTSDLLATSDQHDTVVIWDSKDGNMRVSPLQREECRLRDIAFSPDGTSLLAISPYLDVLRVSDAQPDLALLPKMNGQQFNIGYSLAMSPDARFVAIGKEQNTLEIWDANTGELVKRQFHDDAVEHLAYSQDGKRLLSATRHTVKIWKTRRSDESVENKAYFGWWGQALLPLGTTGKVFLAGRPDVADGKIWLWDPVSREGRMFNGHDGKIMALTVSPDGKLLASSSNDFSQRIWDTEDSPA